VHFSPLWTRHVEVEPEEQAKRLVVDYLTADLARRIVFDPNPPPAYGASPDEWMFFRIDNRAPDHVGGSRYVAVHNVTLQVLDLGWLGE
jgi:hypothetical protein